MMRLPESINVILLKPSCCLPQCAISYIMYATQGNNDPYSWFETNTIAQTLEGTADPIRIAACWYDNEPGF